MKELDEKKQDDTKGVNLLVHHVGTVFTFSSQFLKSLQFDYRIIRRTFS